MLRLKLNHGSKRGPRSRKHNSRNETAWIEFLNDNWYRCTEITLPNRNHNYSRNLAQSLHKYKKGMKIRPWNWVSTQCMHISSWKECINNALTLRFLQGVMQITVLQNFIPRSALWYDKMLNARRWPRSSLSTSLPGPRVSSSLIWPEVTRTLAGQP